MKPINKYIAGTAFILLTGMFCAFNITGNNNFDQAKQNIMLREIGHQVLLNSGDSISRVLPVKRIAENEYQITFENEFTFQSDSLISIIRNTLARNRISKHYVVNVLDCDNKEVVFGFAILGTPKDNLIPCSGRKQPKNCYRINLKFENDGIVSIPKVYMLGSIPLIAVIGFLIFGTTIKPKQQVPPSGENVRAIKIANTFFDSDKRQLTFNNILIELSAKENKLLMILAGSPNEVVERARLQKEIWEDEGVIVGRSLDVFISKLRKKLEGDTSIKLANVHGRGYRLEVLGG